MSFVFRSLLAVLGSNLIPYVLAVTYASCQPGWDLVRFISLLFVEFSHPMNQANNTLEQNPCGIAGALEAACQGYCKSSLCLGVKYNRTDITYKKAAYLLNPLKPGYDYEIPQPNSLSAECECNTVVYRCDKFLKFFRTCLTTKF